MDPYEDLIRWSEKLKELPEPVAYIVLDPSFQGHEEGRDRQGRKYVRCSAAVRDQLLKPSQPKPAFGFDATHLTGIPLLRRADLPPEWPA